MASKFHKLTLSEPSWKISLITKSEPPALVYHRQIHGFHSKRDKIGQKNRSSILLCPLQRRDFSLQIHGNFDYERDFLRNFV